MGDEKRWLAPDGKTQSIDKVNYNAKAYAVFVPQNAHNLLPPRQPNETRFKPGLSCPLEWGITK
jgi:hypothetical protein